MSPYSLISQTHYFISYLILAQPYFKHVAVDELYCTDKNNFFLTKYVSRTLIEKYFNYIF